jgi:hypothetical protein
MTVHIKNTTTHAVFGFEHKLFAGHTYCVVVVKQGWVMMPGGGLRPVAEPRRIHMGDEFALGPERSAVRLPADLIPFKPNPEIMMFGHAKRAQAKRSWDVSLSLGDWRKSLLVYGARYWQREVFGWTLTEPQATDLARVDYAGSYGGSFELPPKSPQENPLIVAYGPNPGGTGWLGKGHGQVLNDAQKASLKAQTEQPRVLAPCLEIPRLIKGSFEPDTAMDPIGFGSLTPWSPQRMALLKGMRAMAADQEGYPDDFPEEFWQQTASDQWLRHQLEGGEVLKLEGVLAEGDAQYRIPKPQALLYVRSPEVLAFTLKTHIDTIVLDLDARVMEVIERRLVKITGLTQDIQIEVLQRVE